MQIKHYTSKGSIYIHSLNGDYDYWIKEDRDEEIHHLAAGVHISKAKLLELVSEYPSTLLDQTYCFDRGVEREFFDDAKREQFDGMLEAEETVVFFMVKRNSGRYAIGCSSKVVKIENVE